MYRYLLPVLFVVLTLQACAPPSEFFYFDKVTPPHVAAHQVTQGAIGYPPLLLPTGKRKMITPRSQYFILAIPNCIDMTGRAKDLRKSLADMLYTKLFQTGRFNLYDRNELVNLDTDWLELALKKRAFETPTEINKEKDQGSGNYQGDGNNIVTDSITLMNEKRSNEQHAAEALRANADGLMMVYITSRTVDKKGGGYFTVDYRIVNSFKANADSNEQDVNKNTVLFAGSQKIRFLISTEKAIEYNRDDIQQISDNIFQVFPNPDTSRKGQVVSINDRRMVVDLGKTDHLIPGLRGYIVARDDSVYTADAIKAQHYQYLAEFQVMEVYAQTCTVEILKPEVDFPDVKVGDEVLLK